jgi:DNA-binding transcriptional LysR family regulator
MLDVHRLRVFRSVVASGGIQAAAQNLGYTPSAISQHVSALQRETGLVLLEKDGRGVRPTPAGRELATSTDAVLARLGEAESLVADLRSGRTGRISVGYFASVGTAWLPRVVRRLTHEFPGLRLDLRALETLPQDPADRPDLQLVVDSHRFRRTPGFTSHHLVDDPYVVVMRHEHPLADQDEVALTELAGEAWVDNDVAKGWCRENLLDACASAGFHPQFLVAAYDYPSAIAFVDAGVGITVLPSLGARSVPAGLRVIPVVGPAPVRTIHAVIKDSAVGLPPVSAAVEELQAILAEEGAEAADLVGTAHPMAAGA